MHNFYEQFTAAAAQFADRPAIEVQRRDRVDTFTYRRLEAMAAGIARGWRLAAWPVGIAAPSSRRTTRTGAPRTSASCGSAQWPFPWIPRTRPRRSPG